MFVRDRMSSPAVTVTSDTPFQDALKLIQDHGFRRLPVVDDEGKLVGIVSERDLLYASPARVDRLTVWELNYLLSKLQVKSIMTKAIITTTPDTFIENAARLMAENRIGALPVVDEDSHVVGVITETDVIDLIAMCTHGRTRVKRWTLGAVAEHVLRARCAPVLLVRAKRTRCEMGKADAQDELHTSLAGAALANAQTRR